MSGGDGALEALNHLGGVFADAGIFIELLLEMREDGGIEEGSSEDTMAVVEEDDHGLCFK